MIGAGNMARALIGGLLARDHPAHQLCAADPDAETRAAIRRDFEIATHADNAQAAESADVVVLAVKPQVIDPVLKSIRPVLDGNAVVVSIAAGVPIATIARALGESRAIVRVMPNTPALYGEGASGFCASAACGASDKAAVEQIFGAVGKVFEIEDEALMDVVTAVSGSGPAYFFALAEALAEAGRNAGLDPSVAEQLSAQTAAGAGAMLAVGDAHAAELRHRVTSPGGTTAAALERFEKQDFRGMVADAVEAAIRRGRELGSP